MRSESLGGKIIFLGQFHPTFLLTIERTIIFFNSFTGVCHGDIKMENVMITSWNWILLTDFASFKPTFLPEDNPAEFSYFFDTSRRRTCYIAPERFKTRTITVEAATNPTLSTSIISDETSDAEFANNGELLASMDIFSGETLFTLCK